MTNGPRRVLLISSLLLAAGVFALLPLIAQTPPPREIVVVAKDMAFFTGAATRSDGRNPTIRVRPGERVRLTIVNDDAGYEHDFAVPGWSVRTPVLRSAGRASIDFEVPATPGSANYVCSLHAAMMTGTIEVAAPALAAAVR